MVNEKKEKITIKKPVVKTIKKDLESKATPKKVVKQEKVVETKNVVNKQNNQQKAVKKKSDNLDRTYATGKRKDAVARVWLKKGEGKIIINDKDAGEYLKRPILEVIINTPFAVTETQNKFDIVCTVCGGGLSGQAGAIKHGISKALNNFNKEAYRKELKSAGLITRDPRTVERKKPGLKKARKGQVFSKR